MSPDCSRHVRNLTRDGITVLESQFPAETCDAVRATIRQRAAGDSRDRAEPFTLCADSLSTDGGRVPPGDADHDSDGPPELDRTLDESRSADGGVERPPTEQTDNGGATADTHSGTRDREPLTTPEAIRSIGGPTAWLDRVSADPTIVRILSEAGDGEHAPTRGTIRREATASREPYRYQSTDGYRVVVYLSDVSSCGAGPFAYLAGSHQSSLTTRAVGRLVNTLARRESRRVLFRDTMTPIAPTGPPGTVVIADRTGYHRLLPPATDDHRTLASITYEPRE